MKPIKNRFVLASLILLLTLTIAPAYGEENEVYYCADIAKNGFNFDEKRGSYQPSRIFEEKFKLKLDMASKQIEVVFEKIGREIYVCKVPWGVDQKLLSCVYDMNHFNFNTESGRFVFFRGLGYVFESTVGHDSSHDSIYVSYGKCDKF